MTVLSIDYNLSFSFHSHFFFPLSADSGFVKDDLVDDKDITTEPLEKSVQNETSKKVAKKVDDDISSSKTKQKSALKQAASTPQRYHSNIT